MYEYLLKFYQRLNVKMIMKPIYSTGDKVYLTEEDDFNDYEIVEISPTDDIDKEVSTDHFTYKIKIVKGNQTLFKGESEIFPITA